MEEGKLEAGFWCMNMSLPNRQGMRVCALGRGDMVKEWSPGATKCILRASG